MEGTRPRYCFAPAKPRTHTIDSNPNLMAIRISKQTQSELLRVLQIGLGVAVALPMVIFPDSLFHELGHGLRCVLHGDHWQSIHLIGVHEADCSNCKTALFLAGGTTFSMF